MYCQTWLESHCLQHQPLYNNTHVGNCFTDLCTKCPGYNNNLVITAHFSGTKGVVVNKFDCMWYLIIVLGLTAGPINCVWMFCVILYSVTSKQWSQHYPRCTVLCGRMTECIYVLCETHFILSQKYKGVNSIPFLNLSNMRDHCRIQFVAVLATFITESTSGCHCWCSGSMLRVGLTPGQNTFCLFPSQGVCSL